MNKSIRCASPYEDEYFKSEQLRIEMEEKEVEQMKQRFSALGLKWMNREQSRKELEQLLSNNYDREKTLDSLESAQWHYMDLLGITSSGLYDEELLKKERKENSHLLKKSDGLIVFEEDQCVLFMSQKHDLPLLLCSAYVLGDAWR